MGKAKNFALWENGKFVCERPAKDLAERIGCFNYSIYNAVKKGCAIKSCYQVTESKDYLPGPLPQHDDGPFALWDAKMNLVGVYLLEDIVKLTGTDRNSLRGSLRHGYWVDKKWFVSPDENTPPSRPPKKLITYQLKEGGQVIAEGTASELCDRFGCTPTQLWDSGYRGYRLGGIYEVCKKNLEPPEKTRCNNTPLTPHIGRRGSPGNPVPFDRMKPLSQDVYLARKAGMSYGQYKGQAYKPVRKTDRMKEGLLERMQDAESE